MADVTVYRVEHGRWREGPYGPERAPEVQKDGQYISSAHTGKPRTTPGPIKDGINWFDLTEEHFFGFDSRAAFERWFRGWKKILHQLGYVLATYEVPEEHVVKGRLQLAFNKRKARHIADTSVLKGREVVA